ncbi:MAG: ion transporter [Planctomycetes bacterium]|nr:ion transporter [Planctomycetota bacterium]
MPRPSEQQRPQGSRLRERLFEVVFESDTLAGRLFDLGLLWAIILSIAAVILASIPAIARSWGPTLKIAEWVFTIVFSIEYVLRFVSVRNPTRYAGSFFGLVDLAAILPGYIDLLIPGAQSLLVVRVLRLLRVFRLLKLGRYLGEAEILLTAVRASRPKIIVFLTFVFAVVIIVGALMYLVESGSAGFESIPSSMYWAIVTLCTVGYGDVVPLTPLGKAIASLLMIMGYGVIAVPTGIVSVELARVSNLPVSGQACPACTRSGHAVDATHCKFCGALLNPQLDAARDTVPPDQA